MTKKVLSLMVVLLIAVTSGCGRDSAQPSANQAQPVQQNTATNRPTSESSDLIGEDRAKELALERAGITEDGVRFDRIELDRDDGVLHYEVEFSKDRTEYDADIKADDGTILSFESDYQD